MQDNIIIDSINSLEDSKINLSGKGSVLYIEDGVNLRGSNISFNGNNSVVYLSKSNNPYVINLVVNSNNVVFFGVDNYFNERMVIIASECKHILIGGNCLFSFGVVIRNADAHLIYDINTQSRINDTQSIYIGDHVWIGQNTLLLKGTVIGSGSILGAGSVISNKIVSSNSIWAGNPAKKIKDNIFWSGECVHSWDKERTNKYSLKENSYPFSSDGKTISPERFDRVLSSLKTSNERLDFLTKYFVGNVNRLFIA